MFKIPPPSLAACFLAYALGCAIVSNGLMKYALDQAQTTKVATPSHGRP
jgi:hypothetical protein